MHKHKRLRQHTGKKNMHCRDSEQKQDKANKFCKFVEEHTILSIDLLTSLRGARATKQSTTLVLRLPDGYWIASLCRSQ